MSFEENELNKLIQKIKRYELRISQGELTLTINCERLKIIRDGVQGQYRRTRIMNAINLKTRRRINRNIKTAMERFFYKKLIVSAELSLIRAS